MNRLNLTLAAALFSLSSLAAAQCDMNDPVCQPAEPTAPASAELAQCDMSDPVCQPAEPTAPPSAELAQCDMNDPVCGPAEPTIDKAKTQHVAFLGKNNNDRSPA